jgi:TfoX/Sxy family transcriptional regulator of competence genes
MPGFAKSPPELVERFTSMTADLPLVERRQMFGYPCLFVGGNMVTGLHEARWFVRLGDPERTELLAETGAGPFEVMPGRAMPGYAVLPDAVIADDSALRSWVERAIIFGGTLPPKAKGAGKAKGAAKASRS